MRTFFSRADVEWVDPDEVLEGRKRLSSLLPCAEHKFQHELVRLLKEEVVHRLVFPDALRLETIRSEESK